jgi:hypothetical protein
VQEIGYNPLAGAYRQDGKEHVLFSVYISKPIGTLTFGCVSSPDLQVLVAAFAPPGVDPDSRSLFTVEVDTLSSDLQLGVQRFLASYGVTDELSNYIAVHAMYKQSVEKGLVLERAQPFICPTAPPDS